MIKDEIERFLLRQIRNNRCSRFVFQPFGEEKYAALHIVGVGQLSWLDDFRPFFEDRGGVVCSNYIADTREVVAVVQPKFGKVKKRPL